MIFWDSGFLCVGGRGYEGRLSRRTAIAVAAKDVAFALAAARGDSLLLATSKCGGDRSEDEDGGCGELHFFGRVLRVQKDVVRVYGLV